MTLGVTNPRNHPNFYILRRLVVGERKDFKFGTQDDLSYLQPVDDKPSPKGAWLHRMIRFNF